MRLRISIAALGLALLAPAFTIVALRFERTPAPRALQYVVIPHPDDEFTGWAMVENQPTLYHVFILLTRGEESGACSGGGLQAQYEERIPQPQPFEGRASHNCPLERVDSWNAFLDRMSKSDRSLDIPQFAGTFEGSSVTPEAIGEKTDRHFDLMIGARTARVIFNLGDGVLTPSKVVWAIRTVQQQRFRFPVIQEDDMVGASFWNTTPGCFVYDHPDHKAVDDALWTTNFGVPGGQWVRTCVIDPRVRETDGVVKLVSRRTMGAAWSVDPGPIDPKDNPTALRTGAGQWAYGWLAFPYATYWSAADRDIATFLSRQQAFWRRF